MNAIYYIGDSTVQFNKIDTYPQTGMSQVLSLFTAEGVTVHPHGKNGRSTKSFLDEGLFEPLRAGMQAGDFLLIQFGHNDEKPDVERATVARVTYPEYLGMFIDAARRQGAEPILLTPVARRHFDENGALKHTHGDYPAAMRDLADYRGVRLLDMEKATEHLLSGMGDEASKALFNWQEPGHPNYPDGVQDNTHLCYTGAVRLARIALKLLEESAG